MKTAREYFKEEWGTGFTKATLSEKGAVVEMSMEDIYNTMESFASQPKWISVKERLPKEEGLYLVFRKHPEKGTYKYEIETLKRNDKGNLFWYDYLFITHWQPLPTPPTK